MAQSGFTPISIYYSTTASAVPTAANLVPGELAINTADGKLYYEDSSGVVQVLATKSTGSIGGSNTQVQFNNSGSLGGSSSFTWDGTTVTATKFAGALNGTVGATTASTGAFTTLSTSSTTTLSGLTASTALALDASKNVVSVTNTGTGNNVLSASPTLTGTIAGASLSLSSLTSGRVTYAGTAGLLQDSGNLTWNGTTFAITGGESVTGVLNLSGINQMHQLSGHNFVQGDATKTYLYGGTDGGQIRTANNGSILWDWSDAGLFNWYASGDIKMTLLASGNVGIGSSTAAQKLSVGSASVYQMRLWDGSTATSSYDIGRSNADGYFRFYGNQTGVTGYIWGGVDGEKMRIDSSGNVTLQKNISVGAATPTTSGTGITFPATQSASSDANTLDDYEEGTFSPDATPDSGSFTTVTQSGSYTKIGNVVNYSFIVTINNVGTGTGALNIKLPFICSTSPIRPMGVGRENALTGNTLQIRTIADGSNNANIPNTPTLLSSYSALGTITYTTT